MSCGRVAVVILAAGASKRMGGLKQLLPVKRGEGRSLIRHMAGVALESECGPVIVVVGCEAERVREEVRGLPVGVVENAEWRRGMGGSIGRGVAAATAIRPAVSAGLLMVCDQPLVSSELLRRMRDAYSSGAGGIVACEYAGTVGVPALFDRRFFEELIRLEGDRGAKGVIEMHGGEVSRIAFPGGEVDLDTAEDYGQC